MLRIRKNYQFGVGLRDTNFLCCNFPVFLQWLCLTVVVRRQSPHLSMRGAQACQWEPSQLPSVGSWGDHPEALHLVLTTKAPRGHWQLACERSFHGWALLTEIKILTPTKAGPSDRTAPESEVVSSPSGRCLLSDSKYGQSASMDSQRGDLTGCLKLSKWGGMGDPDASSLLPTWSSWLRGLVSWDHGVWVRCAPLPPGSYLYDVVATAAPSASPMGST